MYDMCLLVYIDGALLCAECHLRLLVPMYILMVSHRAEGGSPSTPPNAAGSRGILH